MVGRGEDRAIWWRSQGVQILAGDDHLDNANAVSRSKYKRRNKYCEQMEDE